MKVIHIKDILNNVKTYNLIRAFKYKDKEYIIYTLNEEIKENNKLYIKDYVIEKNKEDIWITPNYFEWKKIQNIIKEIAKQSSLGFVNVVKDINIHDKETIMVVGNRSFMVIPYYHHLLSNNNKHEWLQTPIANYSFSATAICFVGFVDNYYSVHDYNAVRPVLYLTSGTKITGGDGSQSNPFQLA